MELTTTSAGGPPAHHHGNGTMDPQVVGYVNELDADIRSVYIADARTDAREAARLSISGDMPDTAELQIDAMYRAWVESQAYAEQRVAIEAARRYAERQRAQQLTTCTQCGNQQPRAKMYEVGWGGRDGILCKTCAMS